MDFGGVLRKMRKEAGMSQEALAEKIHISRSNISRLEANKLELKADDLFRWAKETNAQDMLVALACNVDISMAADIVANLTDVVNAGMILLGAIL